MKLPDLRKIFDDPIRRKAYQAGYRAGLKAAAEFISGWNRVPSEYRLDDLILCKFNLTKRKQPRKARVSTGKGAGE